MLRCYWHVDTTLQSIDARAALPVRPIPVSPSLSSVQVPFNIVNATVAYAVEDIVLGDLLYNKSVDFWWIDWQQGGYAGGMVRLRRSSLTFFSAPPPSFPPSGCFGSLSRLPLCSPWCTLAALTKHPCRLGHAPLPS